VCESVQVVTRDDLEAALAELRATAGDPAHGVLGPASTAWRLAGDLVVFAGGGRAALLQLAHPFVAHAIDDHSKTRTDIAGRFQRTFRNVFAMAFGDLDDAFTAARRVHAVHARIHGVVPEAVGAYPAGTPYHANDATTLRWVHATLVDTTIAVRERLTGALSPADRDAFVRDHNRFARLFAIPVAMLPCDAAGHDAYIADMLASGRIAVAPCARDMARFLFGDGRGGLGRLVEAVTAELLPDRLAREFGLTRRPALARAALAALGAVTRALPASATLLPAHRDARRRLVGLPPSRVAAWTERTLFGLAVRTSRPNHS
jgi:uncharacterized protein (DUF2236 family)